ncbi:Soluble hydrogenase 42 kDa subunit [Roseivivax sp. THAF40]|uniref:L-aspartate--glyoxylate aminotransferase BhcA n=1 Tax=unclassified Roseivivax TaxID=2639302 RepID=UPI00126802B3|nr:MULTISPECIES: L-aspartate--glyoxylate aminotransferase BhcA [unclassified Roseivivax]QFS83696.1 Soluble hydrogenase 42 kDa subunit [Roseivivax sp. THAF197b]QFT47498.1 Soluble hydrogenase 42 kDa subunit [Roseivivax sp. THAF40]
MSTQNPVFIPGPTNIPERLLSAMHVQTRDHRAPDFVETFAPVLEDTKKVFGTKDGTVITFPASGTGGWEAAVTNTLSPGDKVLVARYGMFSHRWIDLCQRHGLDVQIIECAWGAGAPADKFEATLSADKGHEIKAVLVTHNETATGVKSDVAAVRAAMDAASHPAMLFVDCVSSLASMPFEMDAWGVDIAVSGSQKGFMLATGMAILGVSPKALDAMESAKLPRTFFDFRDMTKANASGGFPYTPPLQLIYGMRESLKMLFEEGLDNVYARHTRLAEGVRRATKAWGLELVAHSPDLYSDTVSAIYVPKGFDSNVLTEHAFDGYGVSFGIGLGEMNGKAFRIGHLGSLTDVMVLSGLGAIEMAMADLDYPITLGSGVAAAQEFYRSGNATAVKSAA